jgi:hypothetical protein
MRRSGTSFVVAALALTFVAATARAAVDTLAVDSMNPPSPSTLFGHNANAPVNSTNSVEVTVHWNLVSTGSAFIGIYTLGVPGNPTNNGFETLLTINKKGAGSGSKRFSIGCDDKTNGVNIKNVQVVLMAYHSDGSSSPLVTKTVPVNYSFTCVAHPFSPLPNAGTNPPATVKAPGGATGPPTVPTRLPSTVAR